MALVFVLYALFGSVFTLGKAALQYTQPLFLVGSRMMVAGLLLLAYQWIRYPERFIFRKKDLWMLTALGIINIYLTNAFEFWGLQHLTSFKTCFIYGLSPFLSALFCYFLFKERLTQKKWMGLAIGVIGFIPILLAQSSSEELTGHFFFFSWAELSVMAACVCSVYGWILLGQLIKEQGYSPLMANGISMVIGGGLALIHSVLTENWNPSPVTEWIPFAECALALMIISNLMAYNLYGYLLKHYSPTFISFAGFTTPLFAVLFGWLFLGEVATLPFYISAAIVTLGLTLFHQDELKKELVEPKVACATGACECSCNNS